MNNIGGGLAQFGLRVKASCATFTLGTPTVGPTWYVNVAAGLSFCAMLFSFGL